MTLFPRFMLPASCYPGFLALAIALAVSLSPSSFAQSGAGTAVVQPLPSRETLQLSAALSRLARNPRDINALVEAGRSASALGDFEAAIGFFKRGQQISRRDPRVLAGLAGALVRHADPIAAIPLFEQAESAGASPAMLAGDRGLAYDLVGDPVTAQRYYKTALARGSDEEVSRRLAISYAISGRSRDMEGALLPLLRKQDKAAWRTRAFSLAILGKTEEAIKITRTLLPSKLAASIAPYLEYMPRLTSAQQAAAANLGVFPRASEIGQDDSRIAAFIPKSTLSDAAVNKAPELAAIEKGTNPAGKPALSPKVAARLAREEAKKARKRAKREAREAKRASKKERVAPPEVQPAIRAGSLEEPEFVAVAAPPPQQRSQVETGITKGKKAKAPVSPGFDLAALPNSAQKAPAPSRQTNIAGRSQPEFSDMFGDIGKPVSGQTPASGAVDIRKIEPAKPKAKAAPPPPTHPSRIWVQLGIGQKRRALAYDWKRLGRGSPELFKGRKPYAARLNRTNRLLTGPFASRKAANRFLADLRAAGIKGPYIWTSPAGGVVDRLVR